MLSFGLCEGVLILRKITITVDEDTIECLRAFREISGIPCSALIRRAVWAYYQDKLSVPAAEKQDKFSVPAAEKQDKFSVPAAKKK